MSTKSQIKSFSQTMQELGARQQEVLALLTNHHGGLSAWEIADKTRRLVHAVRPRLCELRDRGLVQEAGIRWESRTERHETVWKIVPVDDPDGQLRMTL